MPHINSEFWNHFYGITGVIALLIQIWPVISPRVIRFTFRSKEARRQLLRTEIESLTYQANHDIYPQRFFRALLARCLAWVLPGIAAALWGIAYKHKLTPFGFDVLFSFVAVCFGSAMGIAASLVIRMNQFIKPEDEVAKLKARMEKLN